MSWPVILGDFPALMLEHAVHKEDFDPDCKHTQVFAPCCGRKTPADTVVSLKGLETRIAAGNIRSKANLDWACDGCLHLLILDSTNGWTWSNLYAAVGAPDEIVRHYVAREVETEARLAQNKRDAQLQAQGLPAEGVNPQTVFETAFAHLPVDLKNDPATKRPDVTASKS